VEGGEAVLCLLLVKDGCGPHKRINKKQYISKSNNVLCESLPVELLRVYIGWMVLNEKALVNTSSSAAESW
jgi:hypothetical protein